MRFVHSTSVRQASEKEENTQNQQYRHMLTTAAASAAALYKRYVRSQTPVECIIERNHRILVLHFIRLKCGPCVLAADRPCAERMWCVCVYEYVYCSHYIRIHREYMRTCTRVCIAGHLRQKTGRRDCNARNQPRRRECLNGKVTFKAVCAHAHIHTH